jgi:2-dehydropantoate 2-reductase
MPTIAIIGVGAIGTATASLIKNNTIATTKPSTDLLFCTRRPLQIPLRMITPDGVVEVKGENIVGPIDTTNQTTSPVDWILISTKTYSVPSIAPWFPSLLGPATRIAVLQNGVEHRERFAPYLTHEQQKNLLPVMVDLSAEKQPDGSVLQWNWGLYIVPNSPLGREFKALFDGGKLDVRLESDWTTVAWKKLCVNAASAVLALTGMPNSVIHQPGMYEVALGIAKEVIVAGNVSGARIEAAYANEVLERMKAAPGDGVNSMAADRIAEREMELDARNGIVVRTGRRAGIDMPLNGMVVAVLTAVQSKYLKELS